MMKTPLLHHSIFDAATESDGHLMAQVQRQNRAALERLYERYGDSGADLAFYILRDRVMAQEITLEAFCQVWRLAFQFRTAEGTFLDWLSGIVHQLAIEALILRKTPAYPRAIDPIEQSLTHAVAAYVSTYEWLPIRQRPIATVPPIKHFLRNRSRAANMPAVSPRHRHGD